MKKKKSYYFPHDENSRNDPKLVKLSMDGWDLVGLFWSMIEMMHEQGGYLDNDPEMLSFALRTNKERITTLINYPDIFEINNGKFTSQRVLQNLKEREEKSKKAQESIYKRWRKDTNVLPTNYESNTIKESKVNKRKEIIQHHFFNNPTFKATFESFLDTRKKLRKPATDRAKQLILKDLEKYPIETAILMLEESIKRGWSGVFELKQSYKEERLA
jgi:hypothetical protein